MSWQLRTYHHGEGHTSPMLARINDNNVIDPGCGVVLPSPGNPDGWDDSVHWLSFEVKQGSDQEGGTFH